MDFCDLREGDQEDLDLCLLRLREKTNEEVVKDFQIRQKLIMKDRVKDVVFEGERSFDPNFPNGREFSHWTTLHHAAYNNHSEMVRLLLKMGVDPNIQLIDGRTPLHMACINCHRKPAEILLREGRADPNIRDRNNETALHIAFEFDFNLNIFKALLEAGADPSIRDDSDRSVLYRASRCCQYVRKSSDIHDRRSKMLDLLQRR